MIGHLTTKTLQSGYVEIECLMSIYLRHFYCFYLILNNGYTSYENYLLKNGVILFTGGLRVCFLMQRMI